MDHVSYVLDALEGAGQGGLLGSLLTAREAPGCPTRLALVQDHGQAAAYLMQDSGAERCGTAMGRSGQEPAASTLTYLQS